MRSEVDNSWQGPPPGRQVDVPEQGTAAFAAHKVHGAVEAHLGPAQAARAWNSHNARRRSTADAQGAATGSTIGDGQVAAGNSDRDVAASAVHGGLLCWRGVAGGTGAGDGGSGRGHEGQTRESSSTSCFAPLMGRVLEQVAWPMGYVAEDFPGTRGG